MNVVLLDAQNEAEYGLDLEQKIFAAHGIRFTQAQCHSRADVLESEPLTRPDHPLALMDQVILTPHAAFDSDEAAHALHTRVAETAVSLASGDLPRNTVNREYLLKNYRRFAAELEE